MLGNLALLPGALRSPPARHESRTQKGDRRSYPERCTHADEASALGRDRQTGRVMSGPSPLRGATLADYEAHLGVLGTPDASRRIL